MNSPFSPANHAYNAGVLVADILQAGITFFPA